MKGSKNLDNKKKQLNGKPVLEIIKSRRSVRSYSTDKLPDAVIEELKLYAKGIEGPFSPKVRLEFIDDILEKADGKIGTYGIIKGAQHFILAIMEDKENSLEQIGFVLEKLILFATSLGLGTCWMGGTFKRSDFAKLVDLKEGETLPIVTPIGYPKEQRSIVDHFMRYAAGSNQRKPWSELFYNEGFNIPMEIDDAKEHIEALEAVRLAPSASNKQPWRVLKKGNDYNFYLKSNMGYAEGLGFNIQKIDMGIAMCHFEMVLLEKGINGIWKFQDPQELNTEINNLTYIITWTEAVE